MNEPTNIQTIMQDGKPAFVVIPYDEYSRMFPKTARVPEGDAIPHEVRGPDDQEGVHPRPRLAGIPGSDSEGGRQADGNHPGSPFPDGGGRKATAEGYLGETRRGNGHRH
jgi:hypothetical protein